MLRPRRAPYDVATRVLVLLIHKTTHEIDAAPSERGGQGDMRFCDPLR